MPLDHRTDIYSLGAALYELLTLCPPFPGRGRDEVMAQILQKEPRKPRSIDKKVPWTSRPFAVCFVFTHHEEFEVWILRY